MTLENNSEVDYVNLFYERIKKPVIEKLLESEMFPLGEVEKYGYDSGMNYALFANCVLVYLYKGLVYHDGEKEWPADMPYVGLNEDLLITAMWMAKPIAVYYVIAAKVTCW